MSFKVTGLDDLVDNLKELSDAVEEISGEHQVPLEELFSPSFLQQHSSFSSIDELFSSGGFVIESQDDFDSISEDALDKHISACTQFASWEEFANRAAEEYIVSKFNF